jgi:DNA-directed RNA polymerase subunit alpha
LNKKVTFEMEFTITKGRGYVPAEENEVEDAPIGTIAIDSIFTPIKNVNYNIEDYRVGQKTDFEKLNLNITTDGSIEPKQALTEASKILIQHFMLFSDEKISLEENAIEEFDEDTLHMRQLLKTDLTEFGLSVRALNCLKTAEVFTLGELVSFKKSDMLKFRNFGKKSLTELEDLIAEKGLTFGFDIAKYNLDNE